MGTRQIKIKSIEADMSDCRTRRNYRFNCSAEIDSRGIEFIIETNQPIFIDEEGIFFPDPDSTGNGNFNIIRISMANGFRQYAEDIARYIKEAYRHFCSYG